MYVPLLYVPPYTQNILSTVENKHSGSANSFIQQTFSFPQLLKLPTFCYRRTNSGKDTHYNIFNNRFLMIKMCS